MALRVRSWPWRQTRLALAPGMHWKIPFVDHFETTTVTSQIANLPNQSVRTADGRSLAISGGVAYNINSIEKYHVNVQSADTSIQTLAMGRLCEYVARNLLSDCTYTKIVEAVFPVLRREGWRWGVEIEGLVLTDLCDHRALRLMMMDAPAAMNPQY